METYSLESVLQGKTVASNVCQVGADRKNLVVDYLEKDVMQTHLVNCLRDVFDVINEFKGKKAQAGSSNPQKSQMHLVLRHFKMHNLN